MLSDFIAGTGCAEFIAPNLIEDFAFLRRGYLECEYMNRKMGRIAGGKRSPYNYDRGFDFDNLDADGKKVYAELLARFN